LAELYTEYLYDIKKNPYLLLVITFDFCLK